MIEVPVNEHEEKSDLIDGIEKFNKGLFSYIDGLSADEFVRFIYLLGSIEYDDNALSEGGFINVRLMVSQKKEVADEDEKIGGNKEGVTGINKEETEKKFIFVLKIPVGEEIVKKYVGGKELLKQKRVCKSNILWTLDLLMEGLKRKSVDDDVHSSEEIHSSFWMRHSDLLYCIESFLKSNPSACVEGSDFCSGVDGVLVEVHPVVNNGETNYSLLYEATHDPTKPVPVLNKS